jgi:hypothetical protein
MCMEYRLISPAGEWGVGSGCYTLMVGWWEVSVYRKLPQRCPMLENSHISPS